MREFHPTMVLLTHACDLITAPSMMLDRCTRAPAKYIAILGEKMGGFESYIALTHNSAFIYRRIRGVTWQQSTRPIFCKRLTKKRLAVDAHQIPMASLRSMIANTRIPSSITTFFPIETLGPMRQPLPILAVSSYSHGAETSNVSICNIAYSCMCDTFLLVHVPQHSPAS